MIALRAGLWCLVLGCSLGWGACGDKAAPGSGEADASPPFGALSLAWEITDGTGLLTCDDVDAEVVQVRALPAGGGSAIIGTIGCRVGVGAVTVREDVYNVQVVLVSPRGELGEAFILEQVNVGAGQVRSLGRLAFEVVPRGNVAFFLHTDEAGGNCEPAPDGSGIVQMHFELRDQGGACVPATFEIGAGATRPAGTYESDCAGALFGCIERDQLIRAVGVPSGQSAFTILGSQADGRACHRRISQFKVPGGDLTASLPIQRMVPNPAQPDCAPEPAPDGGPDDAGEIDAAPADAGPVDAGS